VQEATSAFHKRHALATDSVFQNTITCVAVAIACCGASASSACVCAQWVLSVRCACSGAGIPTEFRRARACIHDSRSGQGNIEDLHAQVALAVLSRVHGQLCALALGCRNAQRVGGVRILRLCC